MTTFGFLTTLFFSIFSWMVCSHISRTVFRDFNANGVKDNTMTFSEPFAQGFMEQARSAAAMMLLPPMVLIHLYRNDCQ
jgi:hypothetical protein